MQKYMIAIFHLTHAKKQELSANFYNFVVGNVLESKA